MNAPADVATPSDPAALATAASAHALAYPYKVWGYGEEIALRALLDVRELTGDQGPATFVRDRIGRWSEGRPPLLPADHVAPGVPLLELYARHGDGHLLDTAVDLGRLLSGFRRVDGAAVHREDLEGWRTTIWVDCMALDAPFLVRLARATGDEAWLALGVAQLRAYAAALRDPASGLFHHGYDVAAGRRSPCRWARGNGWALHGLVDTVEALPDGHEARAALANLATELLAALAPLQDPSGLWPTVLDDPTTPLERSTAPLFASAARKARRLGLVPDERQPAVDAMARRATRAAVEHVDPDGGLRVSSATPIGDRGTYAHRDVGVYPWGQGPLLLSLLEAQRAGPEVSA